MDELLYVFKEIVPYIMLLIFSFILEFDIRYKMKLNIENFYTRGIRIIVLIMLSVKLSMMQGIYTYISFILTYIICVILDHRYRQKFEVCWESGINDINIYIKNNKNISLKMWIIIMLNSFKNHYKQTCDILLFKVNCIINILFFILLIVIMIM